MFVLEDGGLLRIVWSKHGISSVCNLDSIKLFSGVFFKIKSEYEKINFQDKKFEEIHELFTDDFLNVNVHYIMFKNQKHPNIIITYRRNSTTMDSDIVEINGFVKGFNEIMKKPELLSGLVR